MKTQIYGTFGPSCEKEEILERMINAGMTGMRLNLSHSSLRESSNCLDAYQNAARKCGVIPQILIDMQGPELRVGNIEEIQLNTGEHAIIGAGGIPVPEKVLLMLEEGDRLLLDDGKLEVIVLRKSEHKVVAEVIRGGILRRFKSVKVVNKNIQMPVLTEHDVKNIKEAEQYGVTALMQPFVCSGEDLKQVRNTLKECGVSQVKIFAKIENMIGVSNIDDILPHADVIIIARGDLGNDMPLWELPAVQKRIEKACKSQNKPYIVVTQMLASMEKNPIPTRAEVSDIFHAVFEGAYGVMVTGESAIGKYPVEVISYLSNTAKEAENFRET